MAMVEIQTVAMRPLDAEILWDCGISHPKSGQRLASYSLDVCGWILGKSSPAVAIEVRGKGLEPRRWPTVVHRGDVGSRFPDVPGSSCCGFHASISLLPYPRDFEFVVRGVLKDESLVPMATIHGHRSALSTNYQPSLHPLPVTTLGRSGSTWLTRLLGQHPQIFAYKPFQHEVRVSSYWMEVFKTLSEPGSYLQSIRPDINDQYWWIGGKRTTPLPRFLNDPIMHKFLTIDAIEELAAVCQQRIEALYAQAIQAEGKHASVFFTEKNFSIGGFAIRMIWEMYAQARELFLIRDFRDMACSIIAFNKRNGRGGFGIRQAASDGDFIQILQTRYRGLFENWRQRRDRAFLVRYEDLVQKPETTMGSISEYLGVDHSPTTIKETCQRASDMTPERQQQHGTAKSPQASIGRWRQDMDKSLYDIALNGIEDIMEELGYGTT